MSKKNDLPVGINPAHDVGLYLQGISNEDLIKLYRLYFVTVYSSDSYLSKDMVMLHRIEVKLRKRGYGIRVTQNPTIYKLPLDRAPNEVPWEHPKD